MAISHTIDLWNVNPTALRQDSSFRDEKNLFDIPANVEDDAFVMNPDDVDPAHAQTQRMIELLLHVFTETTWERRLEVMVEIKVIGTPPSANQEAAKGEKITVFQAM